MTHAPAPEPEEEEDDAERSAIETVLSSHGTFRFILIALAVWTLFEGFALTTSILSPVDVGTDRTAERMLGGLMLVLGGLYLMIAWHRERYRLLLWVPFAAQVAIVVPLLFALPDGALLLVISSIFLGAMTYVWWQSRDVELGSSYDDASDDDEDWDEELDAEPEPEPSSASRRSGRFRRRDA
jgi:hypothetical protein